MHPRGMKKANNREGRNEMQRHHEEKHNRNRNDNNVRGYNNFFHQKQNRGRQRMDRPTTQWMRALQQKIQMLEQQVASQRERGGSRAGCCV